MSVFAIPAPSHRATPARSNNGISLVHRAAQRGVVLVGVAVVLGIVLLQVIDKAGGGGGSGSISPPVTSSSASTTNPANTDAGRPPAEVRVLALNGSGVNGAAATLANELRGKGYSIAGTGNSPLQNGTTVACRVKFEKEATALATTVGAGTEVTTFPVPDPAGSEASDCVVIRGK